MSDCVCMCVCALVVGGPHWLRDAPQPHIHAALDLALHIFTLFCACAVDDLRRQLSGQQARAAQYRDKLSCTERDLQAALQQTTHSQRVSSG